MGRENNMCRGLSAAWRRHSSRRSARAG